VYSVTLDEAIAAMRLTAADMSVKYKETSLSVSHSFRLCAFDIVLVLTQTRYPGPCGTRSILPSMLAAGANQCITDDGEDSLDGACVLDSNVACYRNFGYL